MNQQAMEPFGLALLDYLKGNSKAELIFIRDDGQKVIQPVSTLSFVIGRSSLATSRFMIYLGEKKQL